MIVRKERWPVDIGTVKIKDGDLPGQVETCLTVWEALSAARALKVASKSCFFGDNGHLIISDLELKVSCRGSQGVVQAVFTKVPSGGSGKEGWFRDSGEWIAFGDQTDKLISQIEGGFGKIEDAELSQSIEDSRGPLFTLNLSRSGVSITDGDGFEHACLGSQELNRTDHDALLGFVTRRFQKVVEMNPRFGLNQFPPMADDLTVDQALDESL